MRTSLVNLPYGAGGDSDEETMAHDPYFPSIPSSRTGRVPQWVLDEAAGKPVDVVPFRGATHSLPPDRPASGARKRGRLLAGITVVAACAGVALYVDPPRLGGGQMELPAQAAGRYGPAPGFEESDSPIGSSATTSSLAEGSGFRFSRHQSDSSAPMAWSPCRPLHFVTRPDNAPGWGPPILAEAVARVSQATGLQFVDDGGTTEGPSEERSPYQPERYGNKWAPVLVAWATTSEVPDFGVDIVGEAGPTPMSTTSGDSAYVSGIVQLDSVGLQQIMSSRGEATVRSIVMHELGHLVGLAHTDGPSEVMFPQARSGILEFSAGDLAGLAALGRGDCQPDI